MSWYLVKTKAWREGVALENLSGQAFQYYLLMINLDFQSLIKLQKLAQVKNKLCYLYLFMTVWLLKKLIFMAKFLKLTVVVYGTPQAEMKNVKGGIK